MAWLTLEEAAARIRAPRETLEDWIQNNLLEVHTFPGLVNLPPNAPEATRLEKYVDEDKLFERAENLGWLELSSETWDGPADE